MTNFSYLWRIADGYPAKGIDFHGLKVFSCFACGGGSSMGYKLTGFDVLGCNEIDKRMMKAYIANHKPKFSFLEPIQTFKARTDLPKQLYELDILDGSPPCSSFSVVGARERDWGKEKKFAEGQAEQILDTLFFDFIDLAQTLQPKVVIAENVKGLLMGGAKDYVRRIYKAFDKAGYYLQHFLLDASKMGVPQRRERVFFIALRKDLAKPFLYQKNLFDVLPEIHLSFKQKPVPFHVIEEKEATEGFKNIAPSYAELWQHRKKGDSALADTMFRVKGKRTFFQSYIYSNKVLPTIVAGDKMLLFDKPRHLTHRELCLGGSYPIDYDFCGLQTQYLIGMSVPPVMVAQIAHEVYKQWLCKI